MKPARHPLRVDEYLQHILDAIARIAEYTTGIKDASALDRAWMARDAVIRNIEIIGEAANKIAKADPAFIGQYAEINWEGIRGMRNKLVHDYFEIDIELVWITVKTDLPELSQRVRAVLDARQPSPKAG